MKKYIGLIVVMVLMFSFVSLAKAEDNNRVKPTYDIKTMQGGRTIQNEGNKEGWKNEIQDKREAFREKMQTERKDFVDKLKTGRDAFMAELKTKKEEWRNANGEKRKDFWEKSKRMIAERFEMAVNGLTKVQTRVGEIITKLSDLGKDTTDATEALNLSKDKLELAKAKVAEIKALLLASGENITPEVFEKIKILAREAKDLLKESKEYLHDSIKAIKDLRGEDRDKENTSSDDSN